MGRPHHKAENYRRSKIVSDELIYNNTHFELVVRPSSICEAGDGVFSLESIPTGTVLGSYEGQIKKSGVKIKNQSYCLVLKKDVFIDAFAFPRCILAMINDAHGSNFELNCCFQKVNKTTIVVTTTTEIHPGDELFIPYSDCFWKRKK